MARPSEDPNFKASLHPSRHASKPSLDTNASGLAESTISFSAFPHPPSSIPPSPMSSGFPTPSIVSSTRGQFGSPVRPLVPRRGVNLPARPLPEPSQATSASQPLVSSQVGSSGSRPKPPSHDWNDGASGISGISVDAAEERLLPTSFITGLLQENKDLRRARRKSTASDAFSGISEMTYPPPVSYHRPPQPSRLRGAVPPSSFAVIPEAATRMSSDSETLHSSQGYPGAPRLPQSQQPTVVGVASATLVPSRSIRRTPASQSFPTSVTGHEKDLYDLEDQEYDDDSIMEYKAALGVPVAPPTITQRRTHRNPQPSHDARQSVHSFRSVAPSFISRISIPNSVRRMLNWRKSTKPLPPVPLIPDIPLAVEAQYRRADEAAPLPELVNRAGQLHGLLEKEYAYGRPASYYSATKSETETYQASTQGKSTRTGSWQPLRRRDVDNPNVPSSVNYGVYAAAPPARGQDPRKGCCACLPQFSRRIWIMISVVGVAVLATVIAVAVVMTKRQSETSKCESGFAGALCNLSTCSPFFNFEGRR